MDEKDAPFGGHGAAAGALLNENGPWGGGGRDGAGSGGNDGAGDGGNGGGLGPRNPWRQPPRKRPGAGRGKVQAPSLEDLLRRGRARFGGGLPSAGGKPLWAYGILAFFCLWIIFTSVHRVEPQQRGVVTRFGKYAGTLWPGISLTLPAPIDTVTRVNVDAIRTISVGSTSETSQNLVLTGDQNIVDLAYSVRWNVRDPKLFLFELADPEDTIREVAESAMREEMSRVTLSNAIGPERSLIEDRVAVRMQQLLDGYRAGVMVQGVAINQADPPAAVNDAFKAVSAAQQQAQSYLNDARAYAQQVTAKAQGEAAAFDKVYAEYRLAPEVTRRRMYYETMEDVLAKTDKTIVEAPGVTPYLPLPAAGAGARRLPEPGSAAAAAADPETAR